MIGDRYRYKESSFCVVINDNKDQYGRVLVYWEGDDFTGRVDVTESSYKIEN